jgi:hypothetical protein
MSTNSIYPHEGDGQAPVAQPNRIAGGLPLQSREGAPNPRNLESLRLRQDFAATLGVERDQLIIPCRKPNEQEFFRVRPGEKWRFQTWIFEDKSQNLSGDSYLIDPGLQSMLEGQIFPACLYLCVNRNGSLFVWPVKLATKRGQPNQWYASAQEIAKVAETRWLKVESDQAAGMYVPQVAKGELGEPKWPSNLTLEQIILERTFKDHYLDHPDHPVLKATRGEV